MVRVMDIDISDENSENKNSNNTVDVQQYNANIDSQIKDLNSKIESYKSVKSSATDIARELDNLSNDAKATGDALEKIIISGKPIDNNGVFKSTSSNLNGMASAYTNIANVCSQKISEIEEKISNLKTQYL